MNSSGSPLPVSPLRTLILFILLASFLILGLSASALGAGRVTLTSPNIELTATPAFCQGVYYGDTGTGVNQIETYGCKPDWPETGPEHYYELNITQSQPITLTLSHGSDIDLDLFLLEEGDPDRCYPANASLVLPALAPGNYTISIDGYAGSQGPYALNIDCSEQPLATSTPTATPPATATPTPTTSPTATPTPTVTPTRTHLTYYSYLPSLQQRYPPPTPQPTTVVLQQGVEGYNGVVDTHINSWDSQANYANVDRLWLRQADSLENRMSPLIHFDLSDLPADAHIVEASLNLRTLTRSNGNTATAGVYLLNRSWLAEQATWLRATESQLWSVPGANASPDDRSSFPYDTVEVNELQQWYEWNITAMVQDWLQNPESNNGIILNAFAVPKVQYNFASSEYNNPQARPKLKIRYWTPPPTPVPDSQHVIGKASARNSSANDKE